MRRCLLTLLQIKVYKEIPTRRGMSTVDFTGRNEEQGMKTCVICKRRQNALHCFDGPSVPYCMACYGRGHTIEPNFEEQLRHEQDDFQAFNDMEASDYP